MKTKVKDKGERRSLVNSRRDLALFMNYVDK